MQLDENPFVRVCMRSYLWIHELCQKPVRFRGPAFVIRFDVSRSRACSGLTTDCGHMLVREAWHRLAMSPFQPEA